MKKKLPYLFGTLFVLMVALPSSVEARPKGKIVWMDNYDQAIEVAKEKNKPVIIFFTGSDWCGWCKKLKSEVFDKPEFGEAVGDRYVWVEIDQPMKGQSPELDAQKDRLQKQYGVRGLPAVVIVDSEGRQIAQTGYKEGGPQAYIKHLNTLVGGREGSQ